MKRKKLCLVLIVAILIMLLPTVAAAGADGYGDGYKDVPRDNWSYAEVNAAKKYGLMQGRGDGVFGFGSDITRAEFVTVLNNMFQWKTENPVQPSFSNVTKGKWYYSYIETALRHDVIDRASVFDADVPITREEMAVMLVRALGYKTLAQSMETVGTPFEDVTNNAGYITVASDIGMTKGTSKNAFSPKLTAKREEAAAMLVRVYEKYIGKTDWVHGFYAISSFSQKELSKGMDAVSVGWSRMSYSMDKGAYLNTTSVNGNEYVIPQGYEDIISYFKDNGTKPHLSIYMDTSTYVETEEGRKDICAAILLDGVERKKAVEAIINELTVDYKTIGYNPYSGVSIDFEGMKGNSLRVGFNDFLTDLSKALKPLGKTIYVAVHPATSDGAYYDAYDYRTIGHVADKVILMAHDYNATIMPENLIGSEYYKHTPLTPFASVYYALKAVTDEKTGVQDSSKIVLAISFSSVGWEMQNSKLSSTISVRPTPSAIYKFLKDGAVMGYSDVYRNPYITYKTDEGKNIFLWYEDGRSVRDKLELAKFFGVKGVSFWRLGLIPSYSDEGLHYSIMDSIF